MGTLFPNGVDETILYPSTGSESGEPRHAIGLIHQYKGEPYTYYFGSAWSRYDVRTMAQWQLTAEEYLHNIKNPLIVKITD